MVVYPLTFTIEEKLPAKFNPDKDIANANTELWGKPLHIAFDLTVSEKRAAILLSAEAIEKVEQHADKTEAEIYTMVINHQYTDSQLPVVVEQTIILTEAYQKSLDCLLGKLNKKVEEITSQGFSIPKYVAKALAECPFHIGENAESANQPLVDIIEKDLFKIQEDKLIVHKELIKNFEFPEQPYYALEEQVRSNKNINPEVEEIREKFDLFMEKFNQYMRSNSPQPHHNTPSQSTSLPNKKGKDNGIG